MLPCKNLDASEDLGVFNHIIISFFFSHGATAQLALKRIDELHGEMEVLRADLSTSQGQVQVCDYFFLKK